MYLSNLWFNERYRKRQEKMTNKWNSDEDFARDIQELSVFGANGYFDKEILSNADKIKTRSQRMRRSRFDDDENFNQMLSDDHTICGSVVSCKPVRGRPLKNIPSVNKPGSKSSFLENRKETSATIRRVCGLDFSNDIIENTLRQVNKQKENDVPKRETFTMPNIRFNSSDSKSNSTTASNSSTSSPSFSSQQCLVNDKEMTQDPCKFVTALELDNILNNSKRLVNKVPLPLFEIIKQKSKENISQPQRTSSRRSPQICHHNKNIVKSESKTNCNVTATVALKTAEEQEQKNSVNLLSERDFPPL